MPVVMTRDEVKSVINHLTGDKRLMASLMYGTGLRLMECLRLRIQDIDFSRNEITIRDGKGAKDRMTMLPESLKSQLKDHYTKGKEDARTRRGRWMGQGAITGCFSPQISECTGRLALAMGIPAGEAMEKRQIR